MKVAIVGASGAVGQEFLRVLEERNFPIDELVLFGSARSAGSTYTFRGKEITVNLKVEMIDGVLKVYCKYENDPVNRFFKIMEYDLGYTPLGYVQIWGYGDDFAYVQNNMAQGLDSYCANFWIDNLRIENTDSNPNLVEVDFVSSKFQEQKDFVYVDEWDNRMETLSKAEAPSSGGCGSTISVGAITLCTLLGGAYMFAKGGKKE